MSSRFSAARPKRAGEAFARSHHGERAGSDGEEGAAKKVKFDVRNPSALVADEREEDDILDADVIGRRGGTATKRGAVNIDGYDSDSDNETFHARAQAKSSRDGDKPVNIIDQLDNYDSKLKGTAPAPDEDDDDDMFGGGNSDDKPPAQNKANASGRKNKEVRFLDARDIEGEEHASKSGGQVRLDDGESSDEDDEELAIQEEDVDDEVGAGGLKRHAPKIDAFNMRSEQEDGAFDEAGNFVRKAADTDAVHDRWLEGIKKKDMKKAAEAHEKREAELRRQRKEDDSVITSDMISSLILNLEKGETPLEALARLGRSQAKFKSKAKKVPRWKLKKQNAAEDTMDVDKDAAPEDAAHQRVKTAINQVTEAADRLLGREFPEIYDTEREMLVREYRKETGEEWIEPARPDSPAETSAAGATTEGPESGGEQWEYRWTDGRDGAAKQGPFDTAMMKAWHAAGYFGEGVEFRKAGDDEPWTQTAPFA
ncbi:hypothetical protein RB595_004519 [Gaeumannomyces hyphopodioides]